MDRSKSDIVLEKAPDAAEENGGEVRTLDELELVLVGGGGDDTVCW
jgi:hypothetical protein